ncbi:MAG: hypothetical protein OXG15_07005, partial [Gammaproteobacteria bacterium]|nr:hypothetical protein [Gammaproteobacteria bacterium]
PGATGPAGAAGLGTGEARLLKSVTQTNTGIGAEIAFTIPKVEISETFDILVEVILTNITGNVNYTINAPVSADAHLPVFVQTPVLNRAAVSGSLVSGFVAQKAGNLDFVYNGAKSGNFSGATADIKIYEIRQIRGDISLPEAGAGIEITDNNTVNIKPPPYIGGFWGNAQEDNPDIEVLKRRDVIVNDTRIGTEDAITWPRGWTIRGITPPRNGVGMLSGQEETYAPVTSGNTPTGTPPVGAGSFSFSNGHLVWSGTWPSNGIDLIVEIDMSDFQSNDYVNLSLDTNNNDLWGSARTPDRGVRFLGSGDDLSAHKHTHLYQLRPSGGSLTSGTQIGIHVEAIKAGHPPNRQPVGLFRGGNVTLKYVPASPPSPNQTFTLQPAVENDDLPFGSDTWLFPITWGTDRRVVNHLDIDQNTPVLEFTRDLRNVLCELISNSAETHAAWQFEVWTFIEGILNWHRVRQYNIAPKAHTATNPAYHIYFDLGAILDGQQVVFVARGLGTALSNQSALGSPSITFNTNIDTRFPKRSEIAKGLITTEQVLAIAEGSRKSGLRTYAKPATAVNRWEMIYVLVKDGNGAQHSAAFDVSSWRRLDETEQMNCEVRSQAQLGADQTLSRNSNGQLAYSSGSASVEVLEVYIDIER